MADISQALREQILQSIDKKTPVAITGNNTKAFYGNPCAAQPLSVAGHSGILNYEPTELVMTARAGTSLAEINKQLEAHGQMLGFEPPEFEGQATLGGTIACNLSGPRRPYAGSARDFVLGCRIINGQGQILHFGGEVMKNVAGYDVSRLMAGSLGTLGLFLDISIKVLPRPAQEMTIRKAMDTGTALKTMIYWSQQSVPLSAACHDGNYLYFRLSGNEQALTAALNKIGGDVMEKGKQFWEKLNAQQHAFFDTGKALWRLSVPPATPITAIEGKTFLDWSGAQRWFISSRGVETIRAGIARTGGHAILYKNGIAGTERFHPLTETMLKLHKEIKHAFDPDNIFTPGRMYKGI